MLIVINEGKWHVRNFPKVFYLLMEVAQQDRTLTKRIGEIMQQSCRIPSER